MPSLDTTLMVPIANIKLVMLQKTFMATWMLCSAAQRLHLPLASVTPLRHVTEKACFTRFSKIVISMGRCRLDEQLKERTATMQENHALFGKLQVFDEARKKTEEHCAGQVPACVLRYQHP